MLLCFLYLQRHTNKPFDPVNTMEVFLLVLLLCFIVFVM